MSQHRSLRGSGLTSKHRNVLKRSERIKLMKKGEGGQEVKSAFGLPKFRSIKAKAA